MMKRIDVWVAGLLAGGVLFAYSETLAAMARNWSESPMYSYAFIVPPISFYLLWARRGEFRTASLQPARLLGLAVLGLALLMFAMGEAGAVRLLQQVAFLLALSGIVLVLFGIPYFKVVFPALAYLLFMVPIWDVFTEPLHLPFQQNSALLSVTLLQAFGVPVHREGTFIWLPNVTIEVARACSGVNYLVAVLALAVPLSHIRLPTYGRRLLLIGSALVVAALANGVRVAIIGALSYLGYTSALHGPFHIFHGLFVAAVGYVVLFAGLRFLETDPAPPAPEPRPASDDVVRPRWRVAEVSALAFTFWVIGVIGVTPSSTRVALPRPLNDLPGQLGSWSMTTARSAALGSLDVDAWSTADQHFRRHYRMDNGIEATVDIWYFEVQSQNHEVVGFKAAALHRSASSRSIRMPDGQMIKANVIHRPAHGQIGVFWYDIDGVVESDQYLAKARSIWGALIGGRTNGAAIMISAPMSAARESDVLDALEGLGIELQTTLTQHWFLPRTHRIGKTT
jgi:EpsI family protein